MRNTFSCGRAANPNRVSGWTSVSQDTFHIANFAANSTAWHCLEVRAVSQGLRPKFLWKQKSERERKGEGSGRSQGRKEEVRANKEVHHELSKPATRVRVVVNLNQAKQLNPPQVNTS